jgi:lipid A 3-O-deacylase
MVRRANLMILRPLLSGLVGLIMVVACATSAAADGFVRELKFGVLAHDVPNLWSGFNVESDPIAINVEALLAPSVTFLRGTLQPAIGGSIAIEGGTSTAYLDARWTIESPSGIFFSLGLGAAIHNGQTELDDLDKKALGTRVLFHIPAEIGFRLDDHNSLSVYFEHQSNANTSHINEGLDRLGIRYGYRF